MRRNFLGLTVIVMTALFVCGCEDTAQAPEDGQPAPAAQEPAVQEPAAQEPAVDKQEPVQLIPARPDSAAGEKVESEEPLFGDDAPPATGVVREKARRGMGAKGQGYGGGIITQPISTYFQTRDRIAFEAQIPHGMKMYKAMNGRFPKDLDEFMDKIVKPAGIQLPSLPEGHRYVYDPKKGELQVERPK